MFRKLLKYDIKEVGMVMMPLYAAMLVLAAAAGLSMRFSIMKGTRDFVASTVPGVVTLILMLVYGALILGMAVMTLVMTTRNFRDNLLGSRGYLMNTLPVTTQSQVLSKSLNGLIWIALGGVASAVSGTIALLFVMRRQDWTEFFRTINEMSDVCRTDGSADPDQQQADAPGAGCVDQLLPDGQRNLDGFWDEQRGCRTVHRKADGICSRAGHSLYRPVPDRNHLGAPK